MSILAGTNRHIPTEKAALRSGCRGRDVFQMCKNSSELTWQCDALYLIRFTGVSLQLTFGHRVGFAQVEKGEPVPHRRLLSLGRRPLAAAAQEQTNLNI